MTSSLFSIADYLIQKGNTTNNELELCKLCLSFTISFVSPKIDTLYKALLPEWFYKEAEDASEEVKIALQCCSDTKNFIGRVVDSLEPFKNDFEYG